MRGRLVSIVERVLQIKFCKGIYLIGETKKQYVLIMINRMFGLLDAYVFNGHGSYFL